MVPRQSFRRPYWWILTLVIWHSFAMLVSKQEMLARVPLTIRIGLGLVLAGVAWTGAWAWWASAGNTMWVPLDVQIPASLGHLRTPFKLHVESTYRIFIAVGRQVNSDGVPCITSPLCGNALPRAEWSLSSVQRVITGGSSDSNGGEVYDTDVKWRELGMFQAAGGNYVVDVDLVGDGRSVSGRAPRLTVVEIGGWRRDAYEQTDDANLASLLLVLAGFYLIVREAKIRHRERAAALALTYSLTQRGPQPRDLQVNRMAAASPTVKLGFHPPGPVWAGLFLMLAACGAYAYVQRWEGQVASALLGLCSIGIGGGASLLAIAGAGGLRKEVVPVAPCERQGPLPAHVRWKVRSSKRRPFQELPSFGLVAFLLYFCVAIPLWLLQPLTPMGLAVHLLRPAPAALRVPGMDPLLVQVTSDSRGAHHAVWVNWQPVTWADLSAVLQKELIRRPPNWPVYVEGDPDADWQWVAMTIDTIRGLTEEVYLLTTWKGLPRQQLEARKTQRIPSAHSRGRQ